MQKKYILLKDAPDIKKGAIFEEGCDGGSQNYFCNKEFARFPGEWAKCSWHKKEMSRKEIENQPEWFERIEVIEVPLKQAAKVRKFIKSLK